MVTFPYSIDKAQNLYGYLVLITFSDEVIKILFLILLLNRYLFSVMAGDRCTFCHWMHVTVHRSVGQVVTITLLDYVMIH